VQAQDRATRSSSGVAVIRVIGVVGMVVALTVLGGCRMHPVSLATMVVGDLVSDVDVSGLQDELMGKPAEAADAKLGARKETFVDTEREQLAMMVYPAGDPLNAMRYVVETDSGKIAIISKTKHNIDGMEDVLEETALRDKVIGASPAGARAKAGLGKPVRELRSVETGTIVRVYDMRNWTDARGARYCCLRYKSDRCTEIRLIGVSAATKKDPLRR
jgi:hypothetical protein